MTLVRTIVTADDTVHSNPFRLWCRFVNDPDHTADPTPESLRRPFRLTHREAESMDVALTTARSHLQQAFAKTGTSQQADLFAAVAAIREILRLVRPAH